ncbi:MAG: SelB C-terminal domain-containing protein, partial [Dehalococcoidia bacterium]|nr:SelB C-terminal domain-containing protein [Dehalococcoidia bacterium]
NKLLVIASGYAVQPTIWQDNCQKLLLAAGEMHSANPLQAGTPQAVIQEALGIPHEAFDVLVQQLVATGKLMRQDDMLFLPGNKLSLSPQQESIKQNILNMFSIQVVAPPTLGEIGKQLANSLPVAYYLIKQGLLIDLGGDIILEKTQFERIRDEVIALLKQNGHISIQDINKRFGFSRKYSVPLLTYLDRLGITCRKGDMRVAGNKLI